MSARPPLTAATLRASLFSSVMTMRKLALSLLGALLTLAASLQADAQATVQSPRQGRTFGVAFYNLENLFDTINNNGKYDLEFSPQGKNKWDSHKYWTKINNLSYAISRFKTKRTPEGPAIIGVSEIENRTVLEDLVKAKDIADRNLQIVHHDSPDRRGVDVGLLYDPKQFRPINVTNHTLYLPQLPDFRTRDQMCVFGLLGGQRVGVIVNHWPSRRGGDKQSSWLREAAAELSKHIADSLTNLYPDCGIIIMGDLNDDPNNKSCAEVLGARKKMDQVKPGGFFNPFWQKLDDGIGSYVYRGGWDLFDQIIVGYNLLPEGKSKLVFDGALVINNLPFLLQSDGQYKGYPLRTFSGGAWKGGYSDHLPTEIFLTLK